MAGNSEVKGDEFLSLLEKTKELLEMTEPNPIDPFHTQEGGAAAQEHELIPQGADLDEMDLNTLRIRVAADLADLTGTVAAVERRVWEGGNTSENLERLVGKVEVKRNCLLTSIMAWEQGARRGLDVETESTSTKAVNNASRLIILLREEAQVAADVPSTEVGYPPVIPPNPESGSAYPGGEGDTTAIRAQLLGEVAAVEVERRYSAEYYREQERSNSERTERLERRRAKKAEAERLRAEAERIRAEEELEEREEAQILEREQRRKNEMELDMKEETIRAKLRVLDEVESSVKAYVPAANKFKNSMLGQTYPGPSSVQVKKSVHPPPPPVPGNMLRRSWLVRGRAHAGESEIFPSIRARYPSHGDFQNPRKRLPK